MIGCSPDTVEAQTAFKEKYQLPFTLLADPEHQIAESFGVWALKQRPSGEEYWGVLRATFIIGADGVIARVFPKVSPKTHDDVVMAALRELAAPA